MGFNAKQRARLERARKLIDQLRDESPDDPAIYRDHLASAARWLRLLADYDAA